METVGAHEAKTHLPKLLERVSKGERITIAKHGLPIAVLQPYDNRKRHNLKAIIEELRQFREEKSLGDSTFRDMIEEGRR